MIINKSFLLKLAPIKNMASEKLNHKESGLSYGLSENGYDIRIAQDVILDSVNRRFKLASSIEEFDMPSHLLAVVHDKSTWARQGLSVYNSVIDSGFKGFLTIELAYSGNDVIHIKRGTPIAHLLFHEVAEPVNYEGKYQNQLDEPVKARFV